MTKAIAEQPDCTEIWQNLEADIISFDCQSGITSNKLLAVLLGQFN